MSTGLDFKSAQFDPVRGQPRSQAFSSYTPRGGETLAGAGHVAPVSNFTPWGVASVGSVLNFFFTSRHVGIHCFPHVFAVCDL